MAQGLQLAQRLTQSLVLSPQMQQSLALLQAPTLELKALVEQELQQNPVLEEAPTPEAEQIEKVKAEDGESAEDSDPAEPPTDVTSDAETNEGDNAKANGEPGADDFLQEFERLAQLDQEWRDHFAQTNLPMRASAEDEEKRQFMFDSLVAATSLQEMLLEQVRESTLTEDQRPIAELVVGNIDDYGYLKTNIDELSSSTSMPADKILDVLKVIQSFEPSGVGARDLRECLMLQLERAGRRIRWNTASSANSWMPWANGASRKSRAAPACTSTRCRTRLDESPAWSRGPGGHSCRITTNTYCPKCSSNGARAILRSPPTTITSPTCESATPTRI